MKLLSVVVSAYNEEAGLLEFYNVTSGYLKELQNSGWEYELVFVNDGSRDGTGSIIRELALEDSAHVRFLDFSRNFGHEAAMTAGLELQIRAFQESQSIEDLDYHLEKLEFEEQTNDCFSQPIRRGSHSKQLSR